MKFDMRIKNIEEKKCNSSFKIFYTNLINIFWVVRIKFGWKDLYTIIIEKDQNTYNIFIKMFLFSLSKEYFSCEFYFN